MTDKPRMPKRRPHETLSTGLVCTRTILGLTLLLLSLPALRAQPVLHGNGARALTGRVDRWTCVDIRMTNRGESLIWWESGGVWMRADGSDIDRPLPPSTNVRRILAVRDTNWIGLQYRRDDNFPGLYDIFLCAGNGPTIRDTSAYVTGDGSTSHNDVISDSDALFSGIAWYGESVHFVCHTRGRGDNTGISYGGISDWYKQWRVGSANVRSLLAVQPAAIPDSLESFYHLSVHDMLQASAAKEDLVSIYLRQGGGRASEYSPDSVYIESVLLIELRSGKVIDSCALAAVSPSGLNRTPRILPPFDGMVDVIRNDTANTGLYAHRYAMDGSHLGQFLLTDLIVLEAPIPAFRYSLFFEDELPTMSGMDYDILALDDDSRLLAWTMPTGGGGTDCFVRLFDRDWNPVGYVKRIHEDTTGRQYHPVLAAKGDTLAVAWKSHRGQSSSDSLFVRFFLRDHILDVKEAHAVPLELQISNLWPQPARDSFVMDVDVPLPGATVTLTCRDMLGRELFRKEGSTTTGQLRFHGDVSQLVPGLYFISIRSGDRKEIRKLLVE